jgi:signal peptidase complex subunit 1
MDFEGQKQAELLLYRLLVLFGALGFLGGYAVGSFRLMVLVNAAGLALTLLVVVPNWPWYNQNPLNWLPPLNPDDKSKSSSGGAAADGGGSGSEIVAAGKGRGAAKR